MKFLLVGTLCLLSDLADPTSVQCKFIINEKPYASADECITESHIIVDILKPELQDKNGSVKFSCYPYEPITLKGHKV